MRRSVVAFRVELIIEEARGSLRTPLSLRGAPLALEVRFAFRHLRNDGLPSWLRHSHHELFGPLRFRRVTRALHQLHEELGVAVNSAGVLFHAPAGLAWGLNSLSNQVLEHLIRASGRGLTWRHGPRRKGLLHRRLRAPETRLVAALAIVLE